MNPRLTRSSWTGQLYILTRYTIKDNVLVASRKYDVTEDFKRCIDEAQDGSGLPTRKDYFVARSAGGSVTGPSFIRAMCPTGIAITASKTPRAATRPSGPRTSASVITRR